jgi:hypothetical protein
MNIEPNQLTINTAEKIIISLAKEGVPPFRVATSIEGGLCMGFRFDNILAYLDIDNDGDIGIIAENIDSRKVILNEDLTEEDVVSTIIKLSKEAI